MMNKSKYLVKKTHLEEPVIIQIRQNNPCGDIQMLIKLLEVIKIPYAIDHNQVSIGTKDYLNLQRFSLFTKVTHQRKYKELKKPIRVYVLNDKHLPGENEFVNRNLVINRLEAAGICYAIPGNRRDIVHVWISKDDLETFRRINRQKYSQQAGVHYPG